MAKSEEITGVQKAAILLIALGPDKSSNVFKHLKEDEIEQLTLEIANTRSVRYWMNSMKYVLHSSTLQKVVLVMQKTFSKRHLVQKGQKMLLENLRHHCKSDRSSLSERRMQASC